jgi:hypothetical protein
MFSLVQNFADIFINKCHQTVTPSEMCRLTALCMFTNVSVEYTSSMFRAEEEYKKERGSRAMLIK